MKAILMSIQPKHLCNILNGDKTIELRKKIPKNYKGWVYCYCTKAFPYLDKSLEDNGKNEYFLWDKNYPYLDNLSGKVVCRFWWDETEKISSDDIECYWYLLDDGALNFTVSYNDFKKYGLVLEKSCLEAEEVYKYANGQNLYGLIIKQPEIFDTPMELNELYRPMPYNHLLSEKEWNKINGTNFIEKPYEEYLKDYEKYRFTKAPKSWCYCEVRE